MFALTKVFLLAALALSASAGTVAGHHARSPGHHAAVRRHTTPADALAPLGGVVRRGSGGVNRASCRTRSSSAALSSTVSIPSSSSIALVPTTSSTPPPPPPTTSSTPPPPTTTSTPPPAPTTTWTPPAPTTTWTPDPTTSTTPAPAPSPTPTQPAGDSFSGQATHYDAGMGACGIVNTSHDMIVAVSHSLFDSYPGYKGDNPNANPVCNKGIHATYQGNTIYVTVTDRCEGCAYYDLDFTDDGFNALTQGKGDGRENFTWSWA